MAFRSFQILPSAQFLGRHLFAIHAADHGVNRSRVGLGDEVRESQHLHGIRPRFAAAEDEAAVHVSFRPAKRDVDPLRHHAHDR